MMDDDDPGALDADPVPPNSSAPVRGELQLSEPETRRPKSLPPRPQSNLEFSLVGSRDWRSHPALAPVSHQGTHNTCVAHSACRLLETQQALRGQAVRLDAHQLHQCVLGYPSSYGPTRASRVFDAMIGHGTPANTGLFVPEGPCPNPPQSALRLANYDLFASARDIKAWIADRSPVLAVLSVPASFDEIRDESVFRPGAAPIAYKHALLLIGFDDDRSCWIVQNSCGQTWGKLGYGRIGYGECGILSDAKHPVFRFT